MTFVSDKISEFKFISDKKSEFKVISDKMSEFKVIGSQNCRHRHSTAHIPFIRKRKVEKKN